MYSVTGRIHQIKQPRGGYLPIARFQLRTLEDAHTLAPKENLHPTVVGLAVDDLTRLQLGAAAEDVFQVALEGARRAEILGVAGARAEANGYLARIHGLDDDSIQSVCKLVTFDVWKRSTFNAFAARPAEDTNPDAATLSNIRVMVSRGLHFWQEYGPVTHSGFNFLPSGYSRIVRRCAEIAAHPAAFDVLGHGAALRQPDFFGHCARRVFQSPPEQSVHLQHGRPAA